MNAGWANVAHRNDKPIRFQGKDYRSYTELATEFGVCPKSIAYRLSRGITDERLVAKRVPK